MLKSPLRLAALVLVGFTAAAGQAAAQEDDMFMPGVIGAEPGMSAVDFDSARMSFFNQADANGDLALSPDEMREAMAQKGSPLFEGKDIDSNGSISLDEYMESGNELFTRLDADGDGVLISGEM